METPPRRGGVSGDQGNRAQARKPIVPTDTRFRPRNQADDRRVSLEWAPLSEATLKALRQLWWRHARLGFPLPLERDVILFEGGRR